MLERIKAWAVSAAPQANAWIPKGIQFKASDENSGMFKNIEHAFELGKWPYPQTWSVYYYQYLFDVMQNVLNKEEKENVIGWLENYTPQPWQEWYKDEPERLYYPTLGWMALLYLLAFVEQSIHPTRDSQQETLEWMQQHPRIVPANRYATDAKEGRMTFVKSLSIASDQFVWLVQNDGTARQWVAKIATSAEKEIKNYERLKQAGGATVEIAEGEWMYGHKRMLVMEKLLPLDEYDDEAEIAIQLLTNQLPYLHTFAVHADLKPDNIMKRNKKDGSIEYFIIDMELHTERLQSGMFARDLFTPLFHVDLSTTFSTCSFYSDLLELYGTVVALTLQRVRIVKGDLAAIRTVSEMSEGHIKEAWNLHSSEPVPDPLLYLKSLKLSTPYYVDRAMQSALQLVPDVWIELLKPRRYLKNQINPGGEPSLRYYLDLVKLFKEAQEGRRSQGVHPSQLAPKTIKSCLRCGQDAQHAEIDKPERVFCNSICQQVFYTYH